MSTKTDSSTDKSAASTEPEGKDGADRKVPIEAVVAERAKKRAAQDEAAEAKAELAKAQNNIDVEAMTPILQQIAEEAKAEARRQIEAEFAPLRQEAAKAKMAMQLGLSEAQANKVMEFKGKNPNLTDTQALLLAKQENPTVFGGAANRPMGGLPVSGMSDLRSQSQEVDFKAKMDEARANKDYSGAQGYAIEELKRRTLRMLLGPR